MKIDNPDQFKSRKEALNWLVSEGYKISQGKFYTDCTAGKVLVNRDGSLSKWAVFQYARSELKTGAGSAPGGTLAAEQCRKIKAEADLREIQVEAAIRQRDKYWLHADDAWATLAALIGTLRDAITHYLHEGARDVVTIAGGDQERASEVFECCEGIVNQAFNEVAGNEVNVEFEREVDDGNPEEVNQA